MGVVARRSRETVSPCVTTVVLMCAGVRVRVQTNFAPLFTLLKLAVPGLGQLSSLGVRVSGTGGGVVVRKWWIMVVQAAVYGCTVTVVGRSVSVCTT